jgi:hypothetical protein
MARKKQTTTEKIAAAAAAAAVNASREKSNVVEFVLPTDDDEDELGISGDIIEDLEKIDQDHGGSISWELYCDVPLDKSGQLAKLARSELGGLRDRCLEYGPGEYHVVARAPNGLFVKNTRRNLKISALARSSAPPAAPANQMDPFALMQLMEERAEKRRQQREKERWDTIKFWAPILSPIGLEMAKGLFGRGGSGESIKDMVAAMVGMKQLVGEPNDKSVDTLLKGIELAQSLAPEGNSKGSTLYDVLGSTLRELRPLAESLIQRRQGTAPAPPAPAQLQFAPTPKGTAAGAAEMPGAAAPAGSSPPVEGEAMLKYFEPLLRKLAGELEEFAVVAADPGLAAEALLVKVPRMVKAQIPYEQLKAWLTEPRWWDLLSEFHPGLQPYQAFCDQVREALIQILDQEEQGDEPGGSEAEAT